MDNYPIFIIYSNWSIDTVVNFLNGILPNQIGMMKIIYDNLSQETNKTIAVLTFKLYEMLIEQGYGKSQFHIDFKIKKYRFKDNILPPEDKSHNLFIPVCKQRTEFVVTENLNRKLEDLAAFGILPPQSWRIKCPIDDRESGIVKLGCFIFFRNVDVYTIAIVKFLLNNTHWDDDKNNHTYHNILKINWARCRILNG